GAAVTVMSNDFSFHDNVMAVFDDVMGIGAVTPNSRNGTTTWLQKANFSNYGAHMDVLGPTDVPGASMGLLSSGLPDHAHYDHTASRTSSSTPHAAGVAPALFSG